MSIEEKLMKYHQSQERERLNNENAEAVELLRKGKFGIHQWTGEEPKGEVILNSLPAITIGDLTLQVIQSNGMIGFRPLHWKEISLSPSRAVFNKEELARLYHDLFTGEYWQ